MDSSSLQASFALAPVPTAHVYSASYCGIVLMQGHDGLFARRLPIAIRTLRTWTLKGFAGTGSTGLPLLGLLRNRGVWGFSRDEWVRPLPDPVGNQCRCAASPKPCVQFGWPVR